MRARFGGPEEVVEAISAAMRKPVLKQEPAFTPMVSSSAASNSTSTPSAAEAMAESVNHVLGSQPAQAYPQVLRPLPATPTLDLPPVRRVTVQQERPTAAPVVQWALQPERRRVPREPIVFPRGLNKAAMRMSEKGLAIARGQAGPSLTAAEQAVANKVSSTQQPVAAASASSRRVEMAAQIAESGGRWSLLRQFGGFETEALSGQSLGERAAG